jgi:hypothetical protein
MNKNHFYLHTGESSWDAECLKVFNIKTNKKFLHNGLFQKRSVNNFRVIKALKYLSLY